MTAINSSHLSHPSNSSSVVPKEDMHVLNQEIADDWARYRVRAGHRVHYVSIEGDPEKVFDEETLCRPYLFIPSLPGFPDSDWTKMQLWRDMDGTLCSTITQEPLLGVESWHPTNIEAVTLPCVSTYNQRVQEVTFKGQSAVSKLAPFDWWNPVADRETLTYEIITKEHSADKPPLIPTFLAQLTEQGRVMGFLLEKIQGRPPTPSDLPACELALKGLHALGLAHGDVNRHNFIIEHATGRARIIDLEHAGILSDESERLDLESLQTMFHINPNIGAPRHLIQI